MRPKPDFPWLLEESVHEILTDVLTAPRERAQTLLAKLEAEASDTDPAAANLYGVTLGALGRFEDAGGVFRTALAAHPLYFFARVNLAHCYFEAGQLNRPIQELETALRHAGDADAREQGPIGQVLRSLTLWRDARADQATHLRLRSAMLRERLEHGIAQPGDARRLGAALIELARDHDSETLWPEIVTVLDRARADDPADTEALELLARALLGSGAHNRFGEILVELEAAAPHSPLLSQIRAARRTAPAAVDGTRLQRLAQDAILEGPEGEAAMADLRELARASPRDLNLRVTLMHAASIRGERAEALELADALVAESDTHVAHFNVVQVYWDSGDEERVLHHLTRAWELAADENERQDVLRLVDFLNRRDDRG